MSYNTNLPTKTPTMQIKPEFFRLPTRGRDPYFGLTRSFYYSCEKSGVLRFQRLRKRGAARGITLVPYDAVANLIRSQDGAS